MVVQTAYRKRQMKMERTSLFARKPGKASSFLIEDDARDTVESFEESGSIGLGVEVGGIFVTRTTPKSL